MATVISFKGEEEGAKADKMCEGQTSGFSCCYDEIPDKGYVRKEEFVLACSLIRETWRQEREAPRSQCDSYKVEKNMCFLLCYSVQDHQPAAHQVTWPQLTWKHPHRVPMVIPNLVELTTKMNHPRKGMWLSKKGRMGEQRNNLEKPVTGQEGE